jgi:hypothetical protein
VDEVLADVGRVLVLQRVDRVRRRRRRRPRPRPACRPAPVVVIS